MTSLVLHPKTANDLAGFAKKPPHALLITGPSGSGKASTAKHIIEKILARDTENYPYISWLKPENKVITIDTIRELKQFLRLKLPIKMAGVRRFVVIEQAETMTVEAQNALLKLLEEPPADTLLILTTSAEQDLLATIRSRVQRLAVLRPAHDQLLNYFSGADAEKAYLLSGGLPGLMSSMLADDGEHDLVLAAKTARDVLAAKPFDRLKMIDELAKQPDQTRALVSMVGQMAHAAILTTANQNNEASTRRWQAVLKAAHQTEIALASNAQPRLALLNFLLNI